MLARYQCIYCDKRIAKRHNFDRHVAACCPKSPGQPLKTLDEPILFRSVFRAAVPDDIEDFIRERPLRARLVFADWRRKGKSIYATEEGLELSLGDFHSGTSFPVLIEGLDDEHISVLRAAAQSGVWPVFSLKVDPT